MGKVINFSDATHRLLLQKLQKTYDPIDPDAFVKLVNIVQKQESIKKNRNKKHE